MYFVIKAKHFQILLMAGLLTACASEPMNRIAPNKTAQGALVGVVGGVAAGSAISSGSGALVGAVVGGVAGALIGYDLERKQTTEQRIHDVLINHGATILDMGDNHLISIPNEKLFYTTSPRIRWSSYSMLNLTADYLKHFSTVSIRVVGYTNNLHDKKRDMALSRARAEGVANYLWSQNLDARLIYAQGYGQLYPIASNEYTKGREWNERIEIIFRVARPPLV